MSPFLPGVLAGQLAVAAVSVPPVLHSNVAANRLSVPEAYAAAAVAAPQRASLSADERVTPSSSTPAPFRIPLSLRMQFGAGAIGAIAFNASGSATWWPLEYVGVGARYNYLYEPGLCVDSGVRGAAFALSLRNRARSHHGFVSLWMGTSKWRHERTVPRAKQDDLIFVTRGRSPHYGVEGGWLWQFSWVKFGPVVRMDLLPRFERMDAVTSFNVTVGVGF